MEEGLQRESQHLLINRLRILRTELIWSVMVKMTVFNHKETTVKENIQKYRQ